MRKKKNTRCSGETLVEVMVSIVIFLMMVAMLQGAVTFCTNAQHKSRQIRANATAITKSLLDGDMDVTAGASTQVEFQRKDLPEGTPSFEVDLTLDQAKVNYTNEQGEADSVIFYLYGVPESGGGHP